MLFQLAVTAIEQTLDTDGLTWAKPDWYEKYVMDAVENGCWTQSMCSAGSTSGRYLVTIALPELS